MQIPSTRVLVDEFSRPGEMYFLTHFHEDHMGGLGKGWQRGCICCSTTTATLLDGMKGIDPSRIITLNPGEARSFPSSRGEVWVSAIDANHCPGAMMFMFQVRGRKHLYTGDFRLNDAIRRRCAELGHVDHLFLDATYGDGDYSFPAQEESIDSVLLAIEDNPEKEIFLAVYTVGKNKIVAAVHETFGRRVYLPPDKFKVYQLLGYEHAVTRDKSTTNIRGYARSYLESYFKWTRAYRDDRSLVIIPTGWAADERDREPGYVYIPYSEHCDSAELDEFVQITRPRCITEI